MVLSLTIKIKKINPFYFIKNRNLFLKYKAKAVLYQTTFIMNKQAINSKTVNSLKIGIWEVNLKKNTIIWDTKTKELFEVTNDFIPDYKNTLNFFNRKNLNHFKTLVKSSIKNRLPIYGKFQIITAQKTIKYIECICLVDFVDNKPKRIYGTFKDVTLDEERSIALESAAEKFASVFSSANDAIIILDTATGELTDCNNRTYELTGYNDTELIGFHNLMLFPVENRAEIEFHIKNKIQSNTCFFKETHIKTKDGKLIPVQVASGKKFIIDNQMYLVCFFRDISKRKNDEEYMNMLSLAVSETTDSIIIADPKGKTVWANNAYLELTGFSLKDIVGYTPGFLSKGPETDQYTTDIMRQAIVDKKSIKVTILNYKKNKEKYWYDLNINPVFNKENTLINYIGVGRDVTIRKEKELELHKLLEVTNDQNNKLFNFAHIVSHNIRSHTSNLQMVLDVIENTDNTNEKLAFIAMFKEGTEKLSETIENLNEVITIQKNICIKKTMINLKSEIEKIATPFENKIAITHSIPTDLNLNVIPSYLENILQNVLSNAIKYQSPHRAPRLEISHKTKNGFHIIYFKDNGLGINIKKNRHKLFGMYKTFHGNDDAKGIGLFIIKNQIEAMSGKIEVESEEGLGSTFKLYFNEE